MENELNIETTTTGQITQPEDPRKVVELLLRELGQKYIRREIDLNARAELSGDVFENQPPDVQKWLAENVRNSSRRQTRLLTFVTEGIVPQVLQNEGRRKREKPKKPSQGMAKHIRREKAERRRQQK